MKVQDLYAVAVMEMQGMVNQIDSQLQKRVEPETRHELNEAKKTVQRRLNRFLEKNADMVGESVQSEVAEMDDNYGNTVTIVNAVYADPVRPFIGKPKPFSLLRLDCGGEQYTISAEVGGLSIKSAGKDALRTGPNNELAPDGVFVTTMELSAGDQGE